MNTILTVLFSSPAIRVLKPVPGKMFVTNDYGCIGWIKELETKPPGKSAGSASLDPTYGFVIH